MRGSAADLEFFFAIRQIGRWIWRDVCGKKKLNTL
jgi:hypothetical protein